MKQPCKPRVLFVTYGGGHVRMVLAVARYLRDAGLAEPLILGLTTARTQVLAAGFACLGFGDFLLDGDEFALDVGHDLAAALQMPADVDADESAAYLGLSWSDLVATHGLARAEAIYRDHGRQAFLPVRTLERILRAVSPDAVVATSAPRAERASILAAVGLGIPSLCMVDLFAAYEIEWLQSPGYADCVCVLNAQVRDRLLAAGRADGEVVVTGNPAFDSVNAPQALAAGAELRRDHGWVDDCVVLWASQVEPEHHPASSAVGDPAFPARIRDVLRATVRTTPGMRLVIRPHPSEPCKTSELAANEHLSPSSEDLHALLHAVDIVVVATSTVGIEAWLAGRQVIQVLGSLYSHAAPYEAFGIADKAVGLAGLEAAVRAARLALPVPRLAQAAQEGTAARRVAHQVLASVATR